MKSISVKSLREKMSLQQCFILDVRSVEEFELVNIGGCNIPLTEILNRSNELDKDKEIYVLCHFGRRSQTACVYLEGIGFKFVYNILGGIDQWAIEVDSSIKRY